MKKMIVILIAGVVVGITISGLYKHFVTDRIMDGGGMENEFANAFRDGDTLKSIRWSQSASNYDDCFRFDLFQFFFQKFMDGRNSRFPGFKQFDRTSLKLICRLNKVSAIRPESCHILHDNRCSCRTRKTCNIFSEFLAPVVSN